MRAIRLLSRVVSNTATTSLARPLLYPLRTTLAHGFSTTPNTPTPHTTGGDTQSNDPSAAQASYSAAVTPDAPKEEVVRHQEFVFQKFTPSPESVKKKVPIPQDVFARQPNGGVKEKTTISRSPMRDADDFYDESDPLSADMLEIDPPKHEATLIWLLGAGDSHQQSRQVYEVLAAGLPGFRIVVPNPPKIPITALDDKMERSWYDIQKPVYTPDVDDYDDFKGITKSTQRLHELIHEEVHRLTASLESTPLPSRFKSRNEHAASRLFVGGFAQGGALALYSGIRFPNTLGGLVSFAGYFPFIDPTIKTYQQKAAGAGSVTESEVKRAPGLDAPVLVIHGRSDEAVPFEFAIPRYSKALKPPLSMRIRLLAARDLGHNLGPMQTDAMRVWLLEKLNAAKKQDIEPDNAGSTGSAR